MSIRSSVGGYFERSFDPKTVEETRQMNFIISTEDRDRHKTRLNPDNWQLDNYDLNPVVMYQHQGYGDNPCIKSVPDDIIGMSVVSNETFKGRKVLRAIPTFEPKDINETAEKIFRKLIFGSLRAASVGFLEYGEGKILKEKINGKEEKTYAFEGQELLEWSVVHIPSNAKAGARLFVDHVMTEIVSLERLLKFSQNELLNMKVADVISELRKIGYTESQIDLIGEEVVKEEKPAASRDLNKYEERLMKLKK